MKPIPTIDAHHHLWDTRENSYPWLESPAFDAHFGSSGDLPRPYLLEQYLNDAQNQNIVKSVHVEASFDKNEPARETQWLQRLADKHGFPHGIVAYADLGSEGVASVLEHHCRAENMRGIRMPTMSPAQLRDVKGDVTSQMSEPAWQAGFRLLGEFKLSYDLQAPVPLMREAAKVSASFPHIQLLLTHAGLPLDRSEAGVEGWRKGMRLMAEQPNIALKVTGIPMTDWNYTVDSLRPIVLESIEIFGVERTIFGSNFPIDGLHGTFDQLFDAYREIVADFSADDQAAMFCRNAERIYRL